MGGMSQLKSFLQEASRVRRFRSITSVKLCTLVMSTVAEAKFKLLSNVCAGLWLCSGMAMDLKMVELN
jgi:hypothetical protein